MCHGKQRYYQQAARVNNEQIIHVEVAGFESAGVEALAVAVQKIAPAVRVQVLSCTTLAKAEPPPLSDVGGGGDQGAVETLGTIRPVNESNEAKKAEATEKDVSAQLLNSIPEGNVDHSALIGEPMAASTPYDNFRDPPPPKRRNKLSLTSKLTRQR